MGSYGGYEVSLSVARVVGFFSRYMHIIVIGGQERLGPVGGQALHLGGMTPAEVGSCRPRREREAHE